MGAKLAHSQCKHTKWCHKKINNFDHILNGISVKIREIRPKFHCLSVYLHADYTTALPIEFQLNENISTHVPKIRLSDSKTKRTSQPVKSCTLTD